jgi:hypothetical protein
MNLLLFALRGEPGHHSNQLKYLNQVKMVQFAGMTIDHAENKNKSK